MDRYCTIYKDANSLSVYACEWSKGGGRLDTFSIWASYKLPFPFCGSVCVCVCLIFSTWAGCIRNAGRAFFFFVELTRCVEYPHLVQQMPAIRPRKVLQQLIHFGTFFLFFRVFTFVIIFLFYIYSLGFFVYDSNIYTQ